MAAVLGVAVTVFVADRILGVFPMGPQAAEASAVESPASLHDEFGQQMRATAALTSIPPAPRTLADRLEELRDTADIDPMNVRDALRPSKAWLGPGDPVEVVAPPAEPIDSAERRARLFARRHRLTATAVGVRGGMAIIDGQCVRVGQSMDGMELVSVDRGSATLKGGEITVRLTLAQD